MTGNSQKMHLLNAFIIYYKNSSTNNKTYVCFYMLFSMFI